MFRDLIPVQAIDQDEDLQRGRGRKGLLPDFQLELPTAGGEPEYRLAELKIIGAVEKWYPRSEVLRGELLFSQMSTETPWLSLTRGTMILLRARWGLYKGGLRVLAGSSVW